MILTATLFQSLANKDLIKMMTYFLLFVLIICPAISIVFCLLGIWENNRATESIARFEENQRKAKIMNRIDEDLIKRQTQEQIVRLNDDVCVEKSGDDYHVMVWCGGAGVWISYNVFKNLEEAVVWASIPENVA